MSLYLPNWLNAVTTAGMSSVENAEGLTHFMLTAHATGNPSSWGVGLEGSVDGTDWFTLTSSGAGGNGPISMASHALAVVQIAGSLGNVTSGYLPRLIRVNLSSLSGGSSPTVSASLYAI